MRRWRFGALEQKPRISSIDTEHGSLMCLTPLDAVDARVKRSTVDLCANRRRYSMRRKFKAAYVDARVWLGNVRSPRANAREEQLESAFPSKESATSTGQPHLKKVASLAGLHKRGACDEKPASGGWFGTPTGNMLELDYAPATPPVR